MSDGALDTLVDHARTAGDGSALGAPAVGGDAADAIVAAPSTAEAVQHGAGFGAGVASAEAARATHSGLEWLLRLTALPALLTALTACLADKLMTPTARWCRRCAKLYGHSQLSARARWNFEYVRSMCADPRDASVYVWGFHDAAQNEVQPAN